MAREWSIDGFQFTEDGEEEYAINGIQINEDQAVAGDVAPSNLTLLGVGD